MKKITVVLGITILAYACGSGDQNAKKEDTNTAVTATASVDLSKNPDYQKGLELISKSDCLTCHKIDEKLIGPAYREVANKYTDKDVAMLAEKIIKGGSGVWGQIPMTPHPAVSQADAEQMVKYVLLLKNK